MWDNLINKFIEKKIYIFTISVAMIIFYSINDEILGKFSALHFKQEYGGLVFILALFFRNYVANAQDFFADFG